MDMDRDVNAAGRAGDARPGGGINTRPRPLSHIRTGTCF